MAVYGPVPQRSDHRTGHPKTSIANAPKITKGQARKVRGAPDPDPDWHPTAQKWYKSLKTSGQSDFYQDSDWAAAWFFAGEMDNYLRATDQYGKPKRSPMMFQALMSGMTLLLTTEGDRRRAQIELTDETQETTVAETAVKDYQEMLRKSKESKAA